MAKHKFSKKLSKSERKEANRRAQVSAQVQQRLAAKRAKRLERQTQPKEPVSGTHPTSVFDASLQTLSLVSIIRDLPKLHRDLTTFAQHLGKFDGQEIEAVRDLVEGLAIVLPDFKSTVLAPMLEDVSSSTSATKAA